VVALVTTVTIALNLVVAVGVGVAIAVASFLLRMSRSVVRRSYRGDVARSKPRSATVTADEDLVCYVLSAEAFDALTVDDPPIAIHLLSNLGRELRRRLRRATAMVSQLED